VEGGLMTETSPIPPLSIFVFGESGWPTGCNGAGGSSTCRTAINLAAFSDVRSTIDGMIVDGDTAVLPFVWGLRLSE
jgi:hypothetical protein